MELCFRASTLKSFPYFKLPLPPGHPDRLIEPIWNASLVFVPVSSVANDWSLDSLGEVLIGFMKKKESSLSAGKVRKSVGGAGSVGGDAKKKLRVGVYK